MIFFSFPTKDVCQYVIMYFSNQGFYHPECSLETKDWRLNNFFFCLFWYCFYREVFFTEQKVFNKSESCGFVCFGLWPYCWNKFSPEPALNAWQTVVITTLDLFDSWVVLTMFFVNKQRKPKRSFYLLCQCVCFF